MAEIKHLLAEHNAKFAEQGSVLWAFDITAQKVTPKITVELSPADKEALEKLVEALTDLMIRKKLTQTLYDYSRH